MESLAMLTRDWTGSCVCCTGGISAIFGIIDAEVGGAATTAGVVVTSTSRGSDGSLGMDFLRHGVGSSPVGTGANATEGATTVDVFLPGANAVGATTVDVFLPAAEEEDECDWSWNVEVERIEWPVVSPDKTKGAGATVGTGADLPATADGLAVVGRVTLDV